MTSARTSKYIPVVRRVNDDALRFTTRNACLTPKLDGILTTEILLVHQVRVRTVRLVTEAQQGRMKQLPEAVVLLFTLA